MKIGIISDTHGFLDPRIEAIFAGVDHILHAGDIGNPMMELELKFIAPVTLVLGNNDQGMSFKETEVVTLADKKFLVHHIVNPRALADPLKARIRRDRPDAVIFGHTHKKFAEMVDGVFYFNPGYAGKPKFGAERSVARLHLDGPELRHEFIPL
jgi:putative phosphoesterase